MGRHQGLASLEQDSLTYLEKVPLAVDVAGIISLLDLVSFGSRSRRGTSQNGRGESNERW